MKAKDLTQADVGKWVTLRGEITSPTCQSKYGAFIDLEIEGDIDGSGQQATVSLFPDTILEFTSPPEPPQQVGDVFKVAKGGGCEWTISAIVGDVCLLTTDGSHMSANYPLDPNQWTPVK